MGEDSFAAVGEVCDGRVVEPRVLVATGTGRLAGLEYPNCLGGREGRGERQAEGFVVSSDREETHSCGFATPQVVIMLWMLLLVERL